MAVTTAGSVFIATANADTITGPLRVASVKVVGGAGGMTVNLKKGGSSGTTMYSSTVGNSSEKWEEAEFYVPAAGIYVNISAGSGTVYIYTE